MFAKLLGPAVLLTLTGLPAPPAAAQSLPATITTWKLNTTGAKGSSTNTELNSYVSTMDADVLEVWYTTLNVYIKAHSIPSHAIGPWGPRAEYPSAQNNSWVLTRTPPGSSAASHLELPLGAIGVFVNGVQLFSWSDATSFENENVWHAVAPVVRPDIDAAGGHPSPPQGGPPPASTDEALEHTHPWTDDPKHTHGTQKALTAAGAYHYHTQSPTLRAQLGDDGTRHSPILGFAFDGVPIYGPYGYANSNGSGGIKRMQSSYRKRSMTQRTSLPDGTVLSANLYGPPINATYPLGAFKEDYEYAAGSGDLDEYNGRFGGTPEFPEGVYAYFATIDASGASAFPYTVGLRYWATPVSGNIGPGAGHVLIPGGATRYEPAAGPRTQLTAQQRLRVVSAGGGWQALVYNYTTGQLTATPYAGASGGVEYQFTAGEWTGVFHYDYDEGRFTEAAYLTRDVLL